MRDPIGLRIGAEPEALAAGMLAGTAAAFLPGKWIAARGLVPLHFCTSAPAPAAPSRTESVTARPPSRDSREQPSRGAVLFARDFHYACVSGVLSDLCVMASDNDGRLTTMPSRVTRGAVRGKEGT
jgi:hypothetical protein